MTPPVKYLCRSLESLLYFNPQTPDFYWINDSIGYYNPPSTENAPIYDEAYYQTYVAYAQTSLGRQITDFRVDFTEKRVRHFEEDIVDVGIGSGQFLDAFAAKNPNRLIYGYDINPIAITDLEKRGLFRCVDASKPEWNSRRTTMTMFDVLEHIPLLAPYFRALGKHLICSLPIFDNLTQVFQSRHYKPREHIWYFTEPGLIDFMAALNYRCLVASSEETRLGREKIRTFAFFNSSL